MRKATTLLLLLLSLTSFAQHKTYRNDIFIPGTKANPTWYYAPTGEDFMNKWGLIPGDTVAFKIGANGEDYMNNVDLGNARVSGIVFINDSTNKKQFLLGFFSMGGNCVNVKMLGNGSKSVYYGFKFFHPDFFGLSWACVGNVEAGFLEMDSSKMGVQVITIKGNYYAANYQTVYLHNIFVHNTSDEAFYLGYAHEPAILMDLTIDSCKVRNSGRDGLQTRQTIKTVLTNNDLDSVGMYHISGHDHGILLGDNINGAVVRNNVLKHIQGIGIWNDGWGTFTIECNNIQAEYWGMMTRNIAWLGGVYTDPQEIGYVKQAIHDNVIKPGNGIVIECLYDNGTKPATFNFYNNQTSGSYNIQTGVSFTQTNNSLQTIPSCGTSNIPVPLPVQLESFTAVKKGRAVLIQWRASESAFDHYELQKSTNGISYTLNARVAGGQTNYAVYDYFPSEVNYYRLKMIDRDNTYTYSKVVVVNMSKSNKVRSIYNLVGADMGTDAGKLKKGFYVVVYEDGSKEYLIR
jgi:hypothetical protein